MIFDVYSISAKPIMVKLEYQVSHKSNNKEDSGVIREDVTIVLESEINGQPNPDRENLLQMLSSNISNPVTLKYVLPKFLKVTNRGTAKPISVLMDSETGLKYFSFILYLLPLLFVKSNNFHNST